MAGFLVVKLEKLRTNTPSSILSMHTCSKPLVPFLPPFFAISSRSLPFSHLSLFFLFWKSANVLMLATNVSIHLWNNRNENNEILLLVAFLFKYKKKKKR